MALTRLAFCVVQRQGRAEMKSNLDERVEESGQLSRTASAGGYGGG